MVAVARLGWAATPAGWALPCHDRPAPVLCACPGPVHSDDVDSLPRSWHARMAPPPPSMTEFERDPSPLSRAASSDGLASTPLPSRRPGTGALPWRAGRGGDDVPPPTQPP